MPVLTNGLEDSGRVTRLSTYTAPSVLEHELAGVLATVAAQTPAEDHGNLFADALAAHRHRCTSLLENVLDDVAARGMSEHALELFAHGYTPERVHALVAAYREQRRAIREAGRRVRESLSGTQGEPATFDELVELRGRVRAALELANTLRGLDACTDVVIRLLAVLEGNR